MKRVFAILFVMMLLFTVSLTAFADDPWGVPGSVTGGTGSENVVVTPDVIS